MLENKKQRCIKHPVFFFFLIRFYRHKCSIKVSKCSLSTSVFHCASWTRASSQNNSEQPCCWGWEAD